MIRHDTGDFHGYQMDISWPEAQEFRKSLTKADGTKLPEKDFHVSLNGGIGDAVSARDAAKLTGDE